MARKRKNGQGTVRLRSDGRWEGRHIVGYDENGKAKQKSVLAKTKAECVGKLQTCNSSVTGNCICGVSGGCKRIQDGWIQVIGVGSVCLWVNHTFTDSDSSGTALSS